MKKILTIKEGNTDCYKCPLEELCTAKCDVALNLFGINCQNYNLNTLKIEEENKSIDWEQLINPEILIKFQFDEEDYISNAVYTKYGDNNIRLKITFWYDDDTILIEYYIEEDKLIFSFETKEFTIGKLREILCTTS